MTYIHVLGAPDPDEDGFRPILPCPESNRPCVICDADPGDKPIMKVGDEVLLVYPEGDCDRVIIERIGPDAATVRLPDGSVCVTLVEDLAALSSPPVGHIGCMGDCIPDQCDDCGRDMIAGELHTADCPSALRQDAADAGEYIDFGPVANPDGSPTQVTKDMLAGTGRDPDEFAAGVERCYTMLAYPGFDSRWSTPRQCTLTRGHDGAHQEA
jgi:hypothetical protein